MHNAPDILDYSQSGYFVITGQYVPPAIHSPLGTSQYGKKSHHTNSKYFVAKTEAPVLKESKLCVTALLCLPRLCSVLPAAIPHCTVNIAQTNFSRPFFPLFVEADAAQTNVARPFFLLFVEADAFGYPPIFIRMRMVVLGSLSIERYASAQRCVSFVHFLYART